MELKTEWQKQLAKRKLKSTADAEVSVVSLTIGVAGGAEKCKWLTQSAGLDGAIDYKSKDIEFGYKRYVQTASPSSSTSLAEAY